MDSRKSIQNLPRSIYSLLGSTTGVTSGWADSVGQIVKSLSSKKLSTETETAVDSDRLNTLATRMSELDNQRKLALNEFLDLKGNIHVYCRLRPTTEAENATHSVSVEAVDSCRVLLKFAGHKSKLYTFDKVFHPASSQEEVFSEIKPAVKSALDGCNSCIFAYGQTGAGKTFTMEGTPGNPGIVPCTIEQLFKQADKSNRTFLFGFSMLEIYLGNLKDLFVPLCKNTTIMPPHLSIQTDPEGGIQIVNLVTIQVNDFEQTLKLYKLGCQCRSTAATNSNISSSRSHCMIRISIFDAPERKRETSKLWMIDLGGSERLLKTKARGIRLQESKAINLSLSALGDVINALQRKKKHIPYRNSKLTQVLKDSLGEDSKTLMLVHISPKEEDLCETVCSLNFAKRVRSTQLEIEESAQARCQKEAAMSNLQQKVKQIEEEREDVRREIEKLKEKLKHLNRAASSSTEIQDVSRISIEVTRPTIGDVNKRAREIKAAPLSQYLPRFMRSTFCSRKKLGMDSETLKNRIPVPARRRALRPHGDTGNINVKDCNSECNVSKFSCNMKRSADCETDYSRSDYDIKTDVFPVLNVLRSSCHHKAQPTNNGSNRHGRKLLEDNSKRFLKVDEWLHLHKNGERTSDHPQKSRGIQAIPEKSRCGVSNYENKKKYHGKTKNLMDARRAQSFTSETTNEITPVPFKDSFDEVTEKILVSLKELFDEDSTCSPNSTHLSHKFDDHAVTRKEDCLLCLMHRENEHSLFSSDNMHKDNIINQDSCRKIETRVLQVAREGEARGITLSRNGSSHSSTSDIENKADMVKNSHENVSMSEQESRNHQVQIHVEMKNYENGVLQTTQDLHEGMIPSQHRVAHQTALSTETDNQENSAMFSLESQGKTQNSGRCGGLQQIIETLCGIVLLGLGFQDAGLGHGFFHGLML